MATTIAIDDDNDSHYVCAHFPPPLICLQIERLHQQLSETQQQMQSADEENHRLKGRVEKLKNTIRKMQSESKSMRARAKVLEHQRSELQKECDELYQGMAEQLDYGDVSRLRLEKTNSKLAMTSML